MFYCRKWAEPIPSIVIHPVPENHMGGSIVLAEPLEAPQTPVGGPQTPHCENLASCLKKYTNMSYEADYNLYLAWFTNTTGWFFCPVSLMVISINVQIKAKENGSEVTSRLERPPSEQRTDSMSSAVLLKRDAHHTRSNVIDPHADFRIYYNWQSKIKVLCTAKAHDKAFLCLNNSLRSVQHHDHDFKAIL